VKLLANDPFRYLYALTQTAIEKTRVLDGPSRLRIYEGFVVFKTCRPVKVGEVIGLRDQIVVTEDFQERWRRGLPFPVVDRQVDKMPTHVRAHSHGEEPGTHWWDKNKIRRNAEIMRRTLRLWWTAPLTNPNHRWLAGMVKVMFICFDGEEEDGARAESIAAAIGESKYFLTKLRPIMLAYADLRRAGAERPDIAPQLVLDLIFPP
jgi:hypothetical protein